MTCAQARESLRQQFDTGAPLRHGVEDHLRDCPGCRRYAQALNALDAQLQRMPLEGMPEDLPGRIQARLAGAPFRRTGFDPVPVLAAGLVLAVAVLGWFFPARPDYGAFWARLAPWTPSIAWRSVPATVLDQAGLAWNLARAQVQAAVPPVPAGLWTLLGVMAAVLAAVTNGFEAARARRGVATMDSRNQQNGR